jgi:surfactin family lipopeptide synthetase A
VSAIALSRNGKADLAATARLRVGRPREHGRTTEEPGHQTVETIVRKYVADVSGLTAERNFFDAGLDSFTMLRLHRELRQAGFPDLDLVDLFRWPTIRALSARLARGGQSGSRDAGVMAGIGASLPRAERRRQARASIKALSAEME